MNTDANIRIYRLALVGCCLSEVILFSFVAYMVSTTGNSEWAWLLLILLCCSPSQCAKLAIKAVLPNREVE